MNEIKTYEDLRYTPKLVELLKAYVSCMFEEYADYSPEALFHIYMDLLKRNSLNALFVQESLDSPLHWVEERFD